MEYSKGFKERMVERMSGMDAVSATALSKEVGVPQPTLSKWLRAACPDHPLDFFETGSGKVTAMPMRRPQDWSAEEKFQVVLESLSVTDEELGAFLRSKGVHESHIEQWRSQMLSGLHGRASLKEGTKKKRDSKEIRNLRQELARKEKALAEAAALLVLKKKPRRSGGTRTRTHPRGTGGSAWAD